MGAWLWKIRAEIRKNTAGMDGKQKAEYILTYYWYHMLFVFLGAGLLVLLIRHVFFGEPKKEFACVIVNQRVDYERDERLTSAFAEASGIAEEGILVDSDYVFSYEGVQLEAANESSYEKFFFRWGSGELDAVLMPESFYRYCKKLEYSFGDLRELWPGNPAKLSELPWIEEEGRYEALYVEDTRLMTDLEQRGGDRMVLVYLPESKHPEAARAFLAFALGGEV